MSITCLQLRCLCTGRSDLAIKKHPCIYLCLHIFLFLILFQVMSISRGLNPQIKLGAQTATIPGSAVRRSIQGILG